MTPEEIDFQIVDHGSVWSVVAVSKAAEAFAKEAFAHVEGWQGTPCNFSTDWRTARDIVGRLASEEDFVIEGVR